MTNEEKFIYILDTCCESRDDLDMILEWIEECDIDTVYQSIHYMFDEDECLKSMK